MALGRGMRNSPGVFYFGRAMKFYNELLFAKQDDFGCNLCFAP